MDEERPDASGDDSDALGTGDDGVDAQVLLNAASRAIAAVRRQAADLFRHQHTLRDEDDAQTDDPPGAR